MNVFSKIIGTVGQPPALVLVVLLLLIKPLKPLYRRRLVPFIILIYVLSIPAGASMLMAPLESWQPSAELIIVQGGGSTTVKDGLCGISSL